MSEFITVQQMIRIASDLYLDGEDLAAIAEYWYYAGLAAETKERMERRLSI